MMPPPLVLRRSLTLRPCSSARRLTTNRPIRRAVSMVTSPPFLSDSLAWASASPAMPRPLSMISISTLPSSSAGLDRDRAARRRVGQGVVDELRHQVDDVGRRAPDDHPVGGGVDAHPLVVLDLGDRGVDDVRDAELLEAGRPARSATEDHQALGRPPHAGGQVVEAEQLLEALRVFLVLLQRLDQRELLVDQRGVAARQGDEHGADLRPQVGLAGRQVDGLLVHVVDGAGELPELLVAVHGDRGDLVGLLAAPDPGDGLGQLLVGDLEGTGAHLAQRARSGHGRRTGPASARRAARAG